MQKKRKVKNSQGITLVALIITVILMLILAGIVLNLAVGENGMLQKTYQGSTVYSEQMAREKLEIVLMDLQMDKLTKEEYNEEEYVNNKLENSGIKIKYDIATIEGYRFEIDRNKLEIVMSLGNQKTPIEDNDALLGKIEEIDKSGYFNIEINGKTEQENAENETIVYGTHIIVHKGDLVLDGENIVEGAEIINNNTYQFGDANDVAKSASELAQNTVVLKVIGNLTINEGITLTAVKGSFGGPKGLIIYCTRLLTNNGTISMSENGAYATPENVYLWTNSDTSFEYVPKYGSNGASSYVTNNSNYQHVYPNVGGANGIGRGTAGGAGGGSGGGSINIFFNNQATGLDTSKFELSKAYSPAGTYNVGSIKTGTYEKLEVKPKEEI